MRRKMKIDNKKVFVSSVSEIETGYIKALTDLCIVLRKNPKMSISRLIEIMSDNLDFQLKNIANNFYKKHKN